MQSDDVIWSVINQQFCSYKVKYAYWPNFQEKMLTGVSEPRHKISVEMSTMLRVCAIDSLVHSQIRDMLRYERKKVTLQNIAEG